MNWWINTGSKLRYKILAFVTSMGQSKIKCESTTGFKTMASHISPSETQGVKKNGRFHTGLSVWEG